MLRIWFAILALCFSSLSLAAEESSMSLLDNRFRVDPSIEQITFVVYRAENSKPVVLVRPDGKKYYAWRSPENVRWYQESAMDIISIDNPMPGPWQAVGKVTPKNKIKLISHLQLTTDQLPNRLYQGESIKFNAHLLSDGNPLVLRDFLDRVELKVTFTKYVENEEALKPTERPIGEEIGVFADDGTGLDEVPGDGIFTVALPVTSKPGKYRVRIVSGNGVFLRAQEQEVLVYPNPVQTTFIQSREGPEPHRVVFTGESGMIQAGSIAATFNQTSPEGDSLILQGSADEESNKLEVEVPFIDQLGNYTWDAEIFATEAGSERPLIFPVAQHSYGQVEEIDLAETRRLQEEERKKQQKLMEELQILKMREEQRTRSMIMIGVGNVVVILIGLIVWFVRGKLKAKKEAIPEMQLEMPKK